MQEKESSEELNEILSYYGSEGQGVDQDTLAEILREIQELFGYISGSMKEQTAAYFGIQTSMIDLLIRLYPTLKEKPSRHRITVCMGRQCMGKNSSAIMEAVEKAVGIGPGETSKDGRFILEKRSCLKHCRTAPNLMIDDDLYSFVKAEDISKILKKYQ